MNRPRYAFQAAMYAFGAGLIVHLIWVWLLPMLMLPHGRGFYALVGGAVLLQLAIIVVGLCLLSFQAARNWMSQPLAVDAPSGEKRSPPLSVPRLAVLAGAALCAATGVWAFAAAFEIARDALLRFEWASLLGLLLALSFAALGAAGAIAAWVQYDRWKALGQ